MSDPQDTSACLSPGDETSRALQTCHTLLRVSTGRWQVHRSSIPCHHTRNWGSHTLEASRAETVGAAVSAVREAVKALSWALAAAMRPSMSIFALGVRTRGLAVLGVFATTGVVALDSSSAHIMSISIHTHPTYLFELAYAISTTLEHVTECSRCSCMYRQDREERGCGPSFIGCISNGMELMQTITHEELVDRCAASRPLAAHLHGCAAGQWWPGPELRTH